MSEYTASMYCRSCKKIDAHRVYLLRVYGVEGVGHYVHIGHLCLQEGALEDHCLFYTEDMLSVRNYNSLISLARKDYPYDNIDEEGTDEEEAEEY